MTTKLRRLELLSQLSDTLLELLTMRSTGMTVPQIAARRDRSLQTIKNEFGVIYDILGVSKLSPKQRKIALANFYADLPDLAASRAAKAKEVGGLPSPIAAPFPALPSPTSLAAVEEDERDVQKSAALAAQRYQQAQRHQRKVKPDDKDEEIDDGDAMRKLRPVLVLVAVLLLGGVAVANWKTIQQSLLSNPTSSLNPSAAASATPSGSVANPSLFTPTPTPTVTATPLPTTVPTTIAGNVLKFGESWFGDGLRLTARATPYSECCNALSVDFNLTNNTQVPLDFNILPTSFYLETSAGKRYPGSSISNDGRVNNFRPGDTLSFTVSFAGGGWSSFLADRRDPNVGYYTVATTKFNSRLSEAYWRDIVNH